MMFVLEIMEEEVIADGGKRDYFFSCDFHIVVVGGCSLTAQ